MSTADVELTAIDKAMLALEDWYRATLIVNEHLDRQPHSFTVLQKHPSGMLLDPTGGNFQTKMFQCSVALDRLLVACKEAFG